MHNGEVSWGDGERRKDCGGGGRRGGGGRGRRGGGGRGRRGGGGRGRRGGGRGKGGYQTSAYLDPLGYTESEQSFLVSVHGQGVALGLPPPVHCVEQPGCQDLGPGATMIILPQTRGSNVGTDDSLARTTSTEVVLFIPYQNECSIATRVHYCSCDN